MRTIITKEILDYGTEVELTAPEKSSEDIGLKIEWVSTPSFWDTSFGKALEE